MRAPAIDFAPRPLSHRMLGALLLLVAIASAAAVVSRSLGAARELEAIEAKIRSTADVAERRRSASPAPSGPVLPQAKINAINSAIARLNVPWSELFAAFETHKPKDVALLALLPDARKRSLVVQAEATTPQAMVEFVELLRKVELFEESYLLKHERHEQESGQPYRFALEVRWKELP